MRSLTHFLKQNLPQAVSYSGRLRIKPLKGDGSDRRVYRLLAGRRTFICVSHPKGRKGSPSENDSFCYIAGHLRARGLPSPWVYAFDPRSGLFLIQDFGDFSLESLIKKIKGPKLIKRVYETILKMLIKIQIDGTENFDSRYCYDTPFYNGRFSWKRESKYFLGAFLKGYLKWKKIPPAAEKELKVLAQAVDEEKNRWFLYRDFQSRNIMIWSGGIGLIDFQAARIGPPQYDLASLLIDPYVSLSDKIQDDLLDFYLEHLSGRMPIQPEAFRKNYEIIAFQRNLQILAAFAFLSQVKGKTYFEKYIPAALSSLKNRISGRLFQPYKNVRQLIAAL
jgi:aminoglycoside/choline kinase family phosphotransferase